jgi:dihydrofolate synthase/folylpolyglutamate synthase
MARTAAPKKKRAKKPASKVSRVRTRKAFTNYQAAMDYLTTKTNYETEKGLRYNVTTFNLTRTEKLLRALGNPQKKIATVHIAGTKGKGSTATMLAKMLRLTSLIFTSE